MLDLDLNPKEEKPKLVNMCKKEGVSFAAMAAIELVNVGLSTLYKAAALKGLSYFVFIAYSYAIGALVLFPLIFIFPRPRFPTLSMPVVYRFLLLSCIGYFTGVCAYKGIEYSSPTLATAIGNLVPAFTFILAIIFRMETLDLRNSISRAKAIGTIVSISGALVAILYKGPKVLSSPSSLSLEYSVQTSQTNWVLGGLLLVALSVLTSFCFILQTQIVKSYPNEILVSVINSLCTAILAVIVCFAFETDVSAWTLKTDMAFITAALNGVFGPSLTTAVHTWGLNMKGPLYVSIFKPFSIVVAAAMGYVFLGDALYLGCVIGATILLIGLYVVIWGEAQEEKSIDNVSDYCFDTSSPERKNPLLGMFRS